jgi:hypothetical protein
MGKRLARASREYVDEGRWQCVKVVAPDHANAVEGPGCEEKNQPPNQLRNRLRTYIVLSAVMHEAATITPRERRPRIPACDGPGLLFRLKLPLLPASFCLTLTTGNRTFSRRVESGNPESGIPRHRQCFSTELDWQFAPIFGNFRGLRAVCPPRLASVGQTRRSATRRRRPALPATHVPLLLEVEGEIARETMSIEAVKDVAPQ